MCSQIFDSVIIITGLILFQNINGTEAIFHNEKRHFITFIQCYQCIAQTHRINLPSPVTCFDIWICDRVRGTPIQRFCGIFFHICFYCICHIVAESKIIAFTLCQNLLILWHHLRFCSLALPFFFRKCSIMTTDLHICKIESLMHAFCCSHNVIRITGIRIKWNKRAHTSNLKIRVNFMTFFYNHCTCNHLMMCSLIHSFLLVFVL